MKCWYQKTRINKNVLVANAKPSMRDPKSSVYTEHCVWPPPGISKVYDKSPSLHCSVLFLIELYILNRIKNYIIKYKAEYAIHLKQYSSHSNNWIEPPKSVLIPVVFMPTIWYTSTGIINHVASPNNRITGFCIEKYQDISLCKNTYILFQNWDHNREEIKTLLNCRNVSAF